MYTLKPITKRDGPGLGRSVVAVQSVDGNPYMLWNLYQNGTKFLLATCDDIQRLPTNWRIIDELAIDAIDFSIVFDGEWVYRDGRWKLQTEDVPYIFWVTTDGILKVQKYGTLEILDLATGVTTISTLRAWKNARFNYKDHGIVVSYVKSGTLFYRAFCIQESDGMAAWEIEREINYISGQIAKANLFLLNDYRTGFAIEDSSGNIHWLITERNWAGMAIGVESLVAAPFNAKVEYDYVEYPQTFHTETIFTAISEVAARLLWAVPYNAILSAENEPDGLDNWGYAITVEFEHGLTTPSPTDFSLTDENSALFQVLSIAQISGNTYRFETSDFNNAYGNLSINFAGDGSTKGENEQAMDSFTYAFLPVNLVPTFIPVPEVEGVWNE